MKFFLDFFPILLFFITFKFYPGWVPAEESLCLANACIPGGAEGAIYASTVVAILASIMQVAILWIRHHRVEKMPLITLALIVVLGGATLFFQNELFIKWKPTLVNWAFALVFFGSHYIGGKPLAKRMMESTITMDHEQTWLTLNKIWIGFFIFMGVLNLFVAYSFSTDTWVNFKLFGMMGLTLVFVIAQAVYLSKHMIIEEENDNKTPDSLDKTDGESEKAG
ncbi:septation protein A [Candidatus Venteria ishoeyi]|uniref:Inner membrane-spanning protein YciB n=1 Tax=Candidatus Venteria ishoeyi TaxID=1899563 RepID=A0A1H6FA29_9GAMM|nr:septation protein A [Candidatus Venteria ishoeyi]MDM8547630.1 septation protein A [Candidatus Venteria ishoeyi]SEH06159.1 Intracellular septation protein [Candidatus Venteria ishoeyi]